MWRVICFKKHIVHNSITSEDCGNTWNTVVYVIYICIYIYIYIYLTECRIHISDTLNMVQNAKLPVEKGTTSYYCLWMNSNAWSMFLEAFKYQETLLKLTINMKWSVLVVSHTSMKLVQLLANRWKSKFKKAG